MLHYYLLASWLALLITWLTTWVWWCSRVRFLDQNKFFFINKFCSSKNQVASHCSILLQSGMREFFLSQATLGASILMLRNVSANIAIQSDQSHFVSPYEAPNKGRMFNLCSTAQRVCCAVVLSKHNPLSGWHHSLCYMNAVNILKAVIQFDFIEFVYVTVFCISTSVMPSWQSVWWHEVYRWYKVFDCGHLDYLCLKAHGWHTRSLLEHSVLALRLTDAKRDEGTASFFFILITIYLFI